MWLGYYVRGQAVSFDDAWLTLERARTREFGVIEEEIGEVRIRLEVDDGVLQYRAKGWTDIWDGNLNVFGGGQIYSKGTFHPSAED